MKVKKMHPDAVIPKYAKPGDSGFDLVAVEDVTIGPGETKTVPTGLAFEIPVGFEIQVRPRSGVTRKTKLRVQLGTIDEGYRGEVGVIVDNIDQNPFETPTRYLTLIDGNVIRNEREFAEVTYLIRKGDRIAQGVLAPVAKTTFEESEELSETERGSGGFGHTGY